MQKYFSRRNTLLGIVELSATFLGVAILNAFESKSLAILGFALLFFLSFIFRFWSFSTFHKQYIPHPRKKWTYHVKLKEFIKQNKNFKKFAFYQLFLNFAIMFASPFFAVYMLKDLGFSYVYYILVTISSSIIYLIATPIIGKFSDRYGNKKLLTIANFAFVFSPLLWLISKDPIYLATIPGIASGIGNAAFILSFSNFTYDSLKEEHRGIGIAYVNLFAGIGTFFGALLGGFLLSNLNVTFMNKFLFVFAIAGLLRLIVALFFLPRIKEIKKVKRFYVPPIHFNPMQPFRMIHTEILSFEHYVARFNNRGNIRKV